jgi:Domain of unknown function (DUF4129)
MLPSTVAVRGAVRPDPDQARAWLEGELARPAYRRSLLERFVSWLGDLWDRLTGVTVGSPALSTAAAIGLLVLLLVLIGVVATRLRREPAARRDGAVLLAAAATSPEEHRARAATALHEGRFGDALVEAFRALASRSLRRGLVEERPALTAHELAADLTVAFPDHVRRLAGAADLFDRVFYGHQQATGDDATGVLALDDTLRTARPASRTPSGPGPVPAVPR